MKKSIKKPEMIKLVKSTFYKENLIKNKLAIFLQASKQLSFGKECENFEKKFSQWQGRKHCIMMNSGSSANLAIIQALLNLGRLQKNDLVGFSALTWSTNVMPLIQLGLKPIPVDVEMDTLNVSSRQLLQVLKKYKLKMLFLTNLLGFCDDIDNILRLCKKNNVLLIEDNCESLGTIYKGERLGNFGLASSVSFYVGHHLSTIEGGAVCTDDDKLAEMLRIVRAHGWDRNLSRKEKNSIRQNYSVNSTFYSRYTFYDLGYNFRPSEINGFIGTLQLKFVNEIIKKRKENFENIASRLYKRTDVYYPIKSGHIEYVSNFAVPVICRSIKIRDQLVKLCSKKVEIRPIVGGAMTEQPFYRKYSPSSVNNFQTPNAKLIHEQGLYFGNNPELTKKEIEIILDIFCKLPKKNNPLNNKN